MLQKIGLPVILLVVLVGTYLFWAFVLTCHAKHARSHMPPPKTPPADSTPAPLPTTSEVIPADYDQATKWFKDLIGVAASLAGFLGIATAAKEGMFTASPNVSAMATMSMGGVAAILVGGTFLGVDSWAVPTSLVALVGIPGGLKIWQAIKDS